MPETAPPPPGGCRCRCDSGRVQARAGSFRGLGGRGEQAHAEFAWRACGFHQWKEEVRHHGRCKPREQPRAAQLPQWKDSLGRLSSLVGSFSLPFRWQTTRVTAQEEDSSSTFAIPAAHRAKASLFGCDTPTRRLEPALGPLEEPPARRMAMGGLPQELWCRHWDPCQGVWAPAAHRGRRWGRARARAGGACSSPSRRPWMWWPRS